MPLSAVCSMGWRAVSQDGPTKIKRHFPFHLSTPLQMKNVSSASGMRWSPWKLQSELMSLEEGKALPWEDQLARVYPQLWLMEASWGDPVCVCRSRFLLFHPKSEVQIWAICLPLIWASWTNTFQFPSLSLTDWKNVTSLKNRTDLWVDFLAVSGRDGLWKTTSLSGSAGFPIKADANSQPGLGAGADFGADCTSFLMQSWQPDWWSIVVMRGLPNLEKSSNTNYPSLHHGSWMPKLPAIPTLP